MMQSFDTLSRINKYLIDGGLKSAAAVTKGFQSIAAETTEYSKETLEKGTAAFEKLVGASSVEKALEAQADYARGLFEAMVARSARVGELYADMAKDAFKPFENLLHTKAK
jgi:hypothetical protein